MPSFARSLSSLLIITGTLAVGAAAAGASPSGFSAPALLSACAASASAQVIFPSETPTRASGPGAIVWRSSKACPGGAGARLTPLGAGDAPGETSTPRTASGRPIAPRGLWLAAPAPHGQILIATTAAGSSSRLSLIQGVAGGPFTALALPSPSMALARPSPSPAGVLPSPSPAGVLPSASVALALSNAYRGDLGLLSYTRTGARKGQLRVQVERHFAHAFTRAWPVGGSARVPQSATIALDFRTDALAVWARGGSIYARDLPVSGAPHPVQRLAAATSALHITALLSDDNRAIVAWAQTRASLTSVYIDRSAAGVRFGAPALIERFRDPDGLASPAASPRLIRLSSESVMIAWAGSAAGHWVVRTAAIGEALGPPNTIAAPGADAMLADLVPGPDADALVLWTEPRGLQAQPREPAAQAIFAARGFDAFPERTIFSAPEQVAPLGPVRDPTVALNPASDGAVVVWGAEGGRLQYALRAGGGAS
jgi:hypothetical protein